MERVVAKDDKMTDSGTLMLKKHKIYEILEVDEEMEEFRIASELSGVHWFSFKNQSEFFYTEKEWLERQKERRTIKVLRCIDNSEKHCTERFELGAEYRIIHEDELEYKIVIPVKDRNGWRNVELTYTKNPDYKGKSYKTWFELAEYTI